MTDLKPENTLFNTDTRKGTIIDLGGKTEFTEEATAFNIKTYQKYIQVTREYTAPEILRIFERKREEIIPDWWIVDIAKALAFGCGKVIQFVCGDKIIREKKIVWWETITGKGTDLQDLDQIIALIEKLTKQDPKLRISIEEAIIAIEKMGGHDYKEDVHKHYIEAIRERIKNNKSSIGINENIEETKTQRITQEVTSQDPYKQRE